MDRIVNKIIHDDFGDLFNVFLVNNYKFTLLWYIIATVILLNCGSLSKYKFTLTILQNRTYTIHSIIQLTLDDIGNINYRSYANLSSHKCENIQDADRSKNQSI